MKKKFFMQKVTLHQGSYRNGGGWMPEKCELTDLYPVAQREHDLPQERKFVEFVLKGIQHESMNRLYTGSIMGGSIRRVNLIVKNINYWILQFSDGAEEYFCYRYGFNWTKGALVRDERGLLHVHHKYTAEPDNPARIRFRWDVDETKIRGMFTINVSVRMENVPDYGGRFKTWLVTKWPRLKKHVKFVTHPTFTVQLTIHTSACRVYIFDIASVEVDACSQTVMSKSKLEVAKDESCRSRADFRSYGALQVG